MILSFLISIPFMIAKEGAKWSQFVTTFNTNPIVSFNLIASGLWFYFYNELSTIDTALFVARVKRSRRPSAGSPTPTAATCRQDQRR